MTAEKIEIELDEIFHALYTPGTYPFVSDWTTDGVTSTMVIEFCKKHNIHCTVQNAQHEVIAYHEATVKGHGYVPRMDFFVADDHCFWYSADQEEPYAQAKVKSITNSSNKKRRKVDSPNSPDTKLPR